MVLLVPKTGSQSVDGICQQTDSKNRFYLDVKTGQGESLATTVSLLVQHPVFFVNLQLARICK